MSSVMCSNNIVVVGGGTAGWLTACLIAAEHQYNAQIHVTLIESPEINTIGVGEGTWPSMRETLRKIGINESDFILSCDASFKQGSKFVRWTEDKAEDTYYHPFSAPCGYFEADLTAYWRAHYSELPFAELVTSQAQLCNNNLAPKQLATPDFASVANYGYHLDAGKFALYLKQHGVNKLKIRHIQDHVEQIENDQHGFIQHLVTRKSGLITGDLFVDCTGLSSLILGKHYSIDFIDKRQVLFNDTALAIQVDYGHDAMNIASHTVSTATKGGWIWDIGLPTRRGVGHVYSSDYLSDEQAESILREYVSPTVSTRLLAKTNVRKIDIRPGYRKKFWHKNCVAVGMSAGFIEPLEASALALVELSAAMISKHIPKSRAMMKIIEKRYNQVFSYRWERIIDFLKLHYVLSKRTDSDYWRDNRSCETIPHRLSELLELWSFQSPSRYDFPQIDEIFPAPSYLYVLNGMGFDFSQRPTELDSQYVKIAQRLINENKNKTAKLLAALKSNRELLSQLNQRPFPARFQPA